MRAMKIIAHLGIISLLVMIWLPGCSVVDKIKDAEPWKPFKDCVSATVPTNETIDSCIESVTMLAELTSTIKRVGLLTKEQEVKIISKLYDVAILLKIIKQYKGVNGDATTLLKVQTELINLKEVLEEVKKN